MTALPLGHHASVPGQKAVQTILVVDDEAAFRSLVVRQLNKAGYNTMEASNGAEAIDIFAERRNEISAVLLDLVMPNTSGSETLAKLRYYAPALPVIITSGYSSFEAKSLKETERGVGFLGKPFTGAELSDALRSVLAEQLPKSRHASPPPATAVRPRTIHVLVLEDNPDDQELLRRTLGKVTSVIFDVEIVSQLSHAIAMLAVRRFDAVLVDLTLPDSRDIDTIRNLHLKAPEIPLIALTGQDDTGTELAALAIGAQDYLVKGHDDERSLTRAIRHAMERKRLENAQALLTNQLKKALAEVRTLTGLLPVCAHCKRVRDDTGYWEQIDLYIRNHTEAEVSHGICPYCTETLYGDLIK